MSTFSSSPLWALVVGILLLLSGRRLYWMLVGVVGFVAGLTFAEQLIGNQAALVVLAIAVVAGLLGAVLALALQKVMVAVAGFVIGGGLAATLFPGASPHLLAGVAAASLPVLIGGIIGALLVLLLFDWALIVLSSLLGAALVVQPLTSDPLLIRAVFGAAFLMGVVVQFLRLQRTVPRLDDADS